MPENKDKEESKVGERILDSLNNSIEVIIRYFMTGVSVCGAIYLSCNDQNFFCEKIFESYQIFSGIALVVGFFYFCFVPCGLLAIN